MSYYGLNILDAPQIVRADMLLDVEAIILRINRLENYLGLSRSAMTTAGPMDDMTTLFAIVGETSLSAMRDRVDYLRAHYGRRNSVGGIRPRRRTLKAQQRMTYAELMPGNYWNSVRQ